MKKVKLDFSKVLVTFKQTDADLSVLTSSVVTAMDNNPNFPNPVPAIASVALLVKDYTRAIEEAKSLDRVKVAQKVTLRDQIEFTFNQLAKYVNFTAAGDYNMCVSSGLPLAKTPAPVVIGALNQPKVVLGKSVGELVMSLDKRPYGATSFLHQIAVAVEGQEVVWETTVSTRSSILFKNLQSGTKYLLRIGAVGARGQVVYSPVTYMYAL